MCCFQTPCTAKFTVTVVCWLCVLCALGVFSYLYAISLSISMSKCNITVIECVTLSACHGHDWSHVPHHLLRDGASMDPKGFRTFFKRGAYRGVCEAGCSRITGTIAGMPSFTGVTDKESGTISRILFLFVFIVY